MFAAALLLAVLATVTISAALIGGHPWLLPAAVAVALLAVALLAFSAWGWSE